MSTEYACFCEFFPYIFKITTMDVDFIIARNSILTFYLFNVIL
jgi:hypothetical protein